MPEHKPMPGGHDMISSKVGNETKAETKRAQSGGSAASAEGTKASLKKAVSELHTQHPTRHDDLGPHHGGTAHVRHRPAVRPR